jgi:hypothetical protein
MANIGEIGEIINASEVTLEVSTDTYIMLTDLHLHTGRFEEGVPTTDTGTVWTIGKGDNWMTFSLLATTPEISSLNTLTQVDSDGDYTSTAWKVVAKDVSSATKTLAATGYLRDVDYRKAPEGKLRLDCFVRITGDTLTIT